MQTLTLGNPFIYMKVGVHASEDLTSIIIRKRAEISKAGVAFWGYGGNTCHPLTAVQPFVEEAVKDGISVHLLMQEIKSNHFAEPLRAEQCSADGVTYKKIHPDIHVLGSRYALVIDSLDATEIGVHLNQTKVGIGRLAGNTGESYLRGRVDKACLIYAPELPSAESPEVKLVLSARLAPPYAVLLK